MDPISAIFVMVVLTGAFAKGVDLATDGLLSAEVGGGVRGVSHYAVQAGKARWRLANAKAREIRTQSPQGRKVQEILDLAGMFVRVLSGEAVRFGSGVRSSWRSGREQERSVRTERRGDAPWPVTQWLLERAERTRTRLAERAERTRTATPNEDPNGASSGPEPEPNTTTAADPRPKAWELNEGCLFVLDWHDEDERRRPDFCGEDREEGWVYCPRHMRKARAETYQWDDLEDLRAEHDTGDPDDVWQDPPTTGTVCPPTGQRLCERCGERPWTTRYLDPWSLSLDATLGHPLHICDQCAREIEAERNGDPDDYDEPNGDPNTPPGTTPNTPATRGTSMDINSAPAAIAAAEALRGRFEEPESLLTSLNQDAVTTLEGMGDFGTGDETDTAGRFQPVIDALSSAREAWDVYVAALHEEWDEHIAAAEGRTAGAHAPFQEV